MGETAADIIIVGGGLAGTSAAMVMGRAGRSVVVIDTHPVYPKEFRAEKLGAPHVALIDRLGLREAAARALTPVECTDLYRFGHFYGRNEQREYGFAYADLINALRGALPPSVEMAFGRVASTTVGDDRQSVALADGRVYSGRLLVIATGHGDAVRRSVGIERVETMRAVSLSLGFDLAGPASSFSFQSLTSFGHRRADRVAYLTLFPIGATMRANLFVYRDPGEAWTKAFRKAPAPMLAETLPELQAACKGFAVEGAVDVRPIDLITTRSHRRAGVVLLGDAFATTCPIPGFGILRVLTDVERLTDYVPRWLDTPGMGAGKIEQFYDDPTKRDMDARAERASLYSRAMTVDNGAVWTARRLRNAAVRRSLYHAARLVRRGRPPIAATTAAAPNPSRR